MSSDLAAVLVAPDGALRVPPEVFADALAWLILGVADGELPPEAALHLGAFAARAGIGGDMDVDRMRAAVDAYFVAHPLPAPVKTALQQAIRALASNTGALAKDVADVIGTAAAAGVLERTAPPPPGTVGAGPMARFQVGAQLKKKT